MTLSEIVEGLQIDDTKKQLFRNLCAVMETNVEENITKTPFELSAESGIPYDKWNDFLETNEINGWINETIRIIAKVSQRKKLKDLGKENTSTQDVNAYKVLDDYNSNVKQSDNSNVIIMYLPNPNDNDNKN
jgi:exoribonuclease II